MANPTPRKTATKAKSHQPPSPPKARPKTPRIRASHPPLKTIQMCGVNYKTAGANIRSRLEGAIPQAARFSNGSTKALIAAPQRLELLCCGGDGVKAVEEFRQALMPCQLSRHTYLYKGDQALSHLCRLATGLASPTAGDPATIRAVAGLKARTNSPLRFLLDYAGQTLERIKSETDLFLMPSSLAAAATTVIKEIFAEEPLNLSIAGGDNKGGTISGAGKTKATPKTTAKASLKKLGGASAEPTELASIGGYGKMLASHILQHRSNCRLRPISKHTHILLLASHWSGDRIARLANQNPLQPLLVLDATTPALGSSQMPRQSVFYFDLNDLEQRALNAASPQTVAAAEKVVTSMVRSYPNPTRLGELGALKRALARTALSHAPHTHHRGEAMASLANRLGSAFLNVAPNRRLMARKLTLALKQNQ